MKSQKRIAQEMFYQGVMIGLSMCGGSLKRISDAMLEDGVVLSEQLRTQAQCTYESKVESLRVDLFEEANELYNLEKN